MLGNNWAVDGVRRHVNILGGLGRLGIPWSDWLRRGRGGLESASRLSRGLGIIILTTGGDGTIIISTGGDVCTICADTLIAAVRSCLEAGAECEANNSRK